jgi:IPT/TIG domain-containing protein/repeat uncharacterized protein DUF346
MTASPARSRFHLAYQARPQRRALRRPRTILTALLAGLSGVAVPALPVPAAAPPTVSSVSPRWWVEAGGATATIAGTGFTGATAVKFGGVLASNIQVASDTQLTARIPPHSPQVVHVQVTAAGGTSQPGAADRFTYYTELAGALTSPPAATSWGGGRLDAFGRGQDGALWHRWREAGQWSAWESLGGGLAADSADVGAVAWGQGRIDVFVQGKDSALWHKWWNATAWSGWERLGAANFIAAPQVASWTAGRLDLFAMFTDNGLWHKWWDGAQWSGWEPLGGVLTYPPGAVSWAANRIDVFARGVNNGLWHKWWDGAQWSGWEGLGGSLTSGPSPAALGVGVLDVFYRAPGGDVWGRAYTGGWQAPRSLYWSGNNTPRAVASGPGASDLFEDGTSYTLRYTSTPPN